MNPGFSFWEPVLYFLEGKWLVLRLSDSGDGDEICGESLIAGHGKHTAQVLLQESASALPHLNSLSPLTFLLVASQNAAKPRNILPIDGQVYTFAFRASVECEDQGFTLAFSDVRYGRLVQSRFKAGKS